MSLRQPIQYSFYTEEMFRADLKVFDELPSYRKGALIAAAKKRLMADIAISKLISVSFDLDLDMTPTLGANIIKGWLGRSISREKLTSIFSLKGRTTAHKSEDIALTNRLVSDYKQEVLNAISHTIRSN